MVSIGWEAGLVTTAAFSEPVLSIGGAIALLGSPETYNNVMRRFLEDVLANEHMLERERLGETLASVVLIIARDSATCSFINNFNCSFVGGTTTEPSVTPITATNFIHRLFSHVPETFSTFGNAAWINFTHFDVLPCILDGVIPVKLLLDAWCRGVAFHCADNQPIYDVLIPMYYGPLDEACDLKKLSYTIIQVKARVGAAGTVVLESLTGPLIDTGSAAPHKPEYIAALMDLATLVTFRGDKSKKVLAEHLAAVAPQKKTSQSVARHYSSDEPSRWVFNARGLTEATYPSLPQFGAETMHRVLYGRKGDEAGAEGRDVVQTAAMNWVDATRSILTNGS
jgi:hypothetical protein